MVHPVTLLLIEESFGDAGEIASSLEDGGFTNCYQQINSLEVLSSVLEKQDWDMILAADRLPGFCATDILANLRKMELDIPVLVIADSLTEEDEAELLRAGAAHCISRDKLAVLGAIIKREMDFQKIRRGHNQKKVQELLDTRARQLKESEKHFRLLAENTSDLIWTADLNLQTTYISPSVEKILGIPADEYIKYTLEQRFTPETILKLGSLLAKELENEKNPAVDRNRTVLLEVDHYHADGRILRLELHVSISRDQAGKIIGVQGVTRDITERKRIEEELSLKSLVLDQIQDMVTITDLNGKIFFVNEAEARTMGVPRHELIGKTTEFYGEDDKRGASQREIIQKTLREGSHRCEVVNQTPDGRELILDCRTQVVYDQSNNPVALCGISTDITERKRMEAALESRIFALTRPLDQPEGIEIEDLFDIETLQRLQDEFASATGVASIITRPDGSPITRPSNFCRLCKDIIRNTEKGRLNCFNSDAVIGRHHLEGPIIQPCMSGGLWDAGAGISIGGRHIANWLIGQVRDETQTEEGIRAYARLIGADELDMVAAFFDVPSMTHEQFKNVAQLLFTTASQLSNLAYQNVQQARFLSENKKVEKNLRASEQNFREIFNSTSEAIFIDEAETGRIIDVNESMLRMYGYENKSEVLAGNIGDLSANQEPFTEHRAQELVRKAIHEGPQVFEWLAKKRDGTIFWSEVSLKKSTIGGSDRVLAVVRDITERKAIEENLRKSERHFRSLFESTAVGVAITDAPSGKYIHVNDRFSEITGYSPDELCEMSWASLTYTDDSPANNEFMNRLQTGEIQNFSMEKRYIQKNGTIIWVSVSVASMWEPGEEANTTIAVVQDITARKKSEEALRASEERFRRLSDDIPVCISSFLPDSTATYGNKAQAELLGMTPEDVIGRKFLDLLPPDDQAIVKEKLATLNPSNPTEFHEQVHNLKDGRELVMEWRNRAFFKDDGSISHMLGVGIDITDRKKIEEEIRREKEKSRNYLDIAEVMLVALDNHGNISLMNKKGARILGYEENELVGKNWIDTCLPEKSRKDVREVFNQLMAGKIETFEYYENAILRKDGKERLIGWHNTIILTEDGKILGTLSSGEDITDRKLMEIALQISEEKFSTAFHVSPDAININRIKDGLYLEINEGFTRLTGYTVEDVQGKTSLELDIWANPDDRQRLVKGLRENGRVNNLEAIFRSKNGQLRTALMSARIIEVNGEKCILSITRDISDRKEMENALKKSEERYHLIDEASQDLIYSYDLDGRFTHVNSSLCRLLGLRSEEILGKTHADLGFPPAVCEEWDRLHKQVYETGETVVSETQTPIQAGQPLFFEVVLNPMHDEDGKIIGIAGTTRDINARKLAEKKIEEQLDELRRWHNATMGREKRILELKREINSLLTESGKPPRYASPGEGSSE